MERACLCNQHEFKKSGADGKCIEARELIIALPEDLLKYEPDYVLEQFTIHFKRRYGVECISALHHNKAKTNYHIHLIFSERKLLDKPVIKTATRSMFYDENGKRVRTKKEILDENGTVRKKCRVIKKGEVYEKKLFTIKDKRFKQEGFLDGVKRDYTALINTFVFEEKNKLTVYDKDSPYLPTKKIGKNNPKEEQIKTDNWARTEWNHTVDRALVEGVSREDILRVKRKEITEKVQESVHKWGNRPCFFYSIVTHAIDVLVALIEKIWEQFKRIAALLDKKNNAESAENVKSVPVVESSTKETESAFVQTEKDVVTVLQTPEPEEILFSDPTEMPEVKTQHRTITKPLVQEEVIPPRPEFDMGMEEYDKLQEIYRQLVIQENAVLTCEKEIEQLQQELSVCKGVFQGKRRKELEGQTADKEYRIANMKQCLGDIAKGYGYSSVDDFMRVYHHAKTDYADYTKRLKEWADKYGMKYVEQQFEQQQKSFEADINKIKYHHRSNLS